ncbi:hypothetical protein P7C73_g6130, partial [Tremellales sp. Uapishka_1]
MHRSAMRTFRSTLPRLNLSPVGTTNTLLPIRYHIFRTPLPYSVGLNLQNDIIDLRLKAREGSSDILLLLEHLPTYTTGRRDHSPYQNELHPEEKKVQDVGAEFHITKRGGQVTYHGPGQLVGYPLLDLNAMEGLLADYVRETHGLDGILAPHPDGHVGVFASPTEKLASIGIHLRHRITSHGFSLNVTSEPLKWFDLVLACGLDDVKATSLHELLKAKAGRADEPTVQDVARGLIPCFEEVFGREMKALQAEGEGLDEVRELVSAAEKEAERVAERDGWRREPDLSKRSM